MIYNFRVNSEPPFNTFLSDKYDQIKSLYNYEEDLKRFVLLYPDYLIKYPEKRSFVDNGRISIESDPFKKVSLKESWKPLDVRFYYRAKACKIGDISTVNSTYSPVFSEKALEILGDLLENNGEFLELNCINDGKIYYLYNVLTYVDIIDPYKSGSTSEDSRYLLYFKENTDFDKLSIFRIISNALGSASFVSKKFMERCVKNKLKGIDPWTDRTFIEESVTNKNQLEDFKKFHDIIYEGRRK